VKNTKQGSHLGQVFLIVFIDLVGFSVIFPLVPHMLDHYLALEGPESLVGRLTDLLHRIAGEGTGSTIAVHALFGGFLGSLYSGLQFLFAPIWGAHSDRNGRRPTLLITLAGTAFSYLIWFVSGSFILLVLSRLLGGMMSGNISTASAVIGDTTSGKDRAKGMGIIGMAVGLGFILGPALGGLGAMIDLSDGRPGLERFGVNPFSVTAGVAFLLAALNFVWVALRFRETLPAEKRGQDDARGTSLHPFRMAKKLHAPGIRRTYLTYFFYLASFSAVEFTLTFLTFERLEYSPMQNAWIFVYVGFLIALIQGGFIRRLAPRFGEKRLALVGLLLPLPGFVLIGTSYSVAQLYLGLTFMAVGSAFTMPTLSALASRYAPPDRQGLAMGSFRSAGALSRAVGPILGGLI
jgi:MFS family permease